MKITSIAPARICLFGDHQDYLGLPVITTSIDRKITLSAAPIKESHFFLDFIDIDQTRIIPLLDDYSHFQRNDHYQSSLFVAQKRGVKINQGYNIKISGNIPINAGLSSSSAIVVAWTRFIYTAFDVDQPLSAEEIGKLAFQAEVVEHRAPGGKMDQYAISIGGLLFMDMGEQFKYRSLDTHLPSLIIGESGDPKQTNETLKKAKEGALMAIEDIKQHELGYDITTSSEKDLEKYLSMVKEENRTFFKAAVINYETTKLALLELMKPQPNYFILGKIINRHHQTLKEYLKTTTNKIDNMVTSVLEAGAYGAKIVGSGGGGCVVALCPKGKEKDIVDAFLQGGAKDAYRVSPSTGASFTCEVCDEEG